MKAFRKKPEEESIESMQNGGAERVQVRMEREGYSTGERMDNKLSISGIRFEYREKASLDRRWPGVFPGMKKIRHGGASLPERGR